MIFENLLDEMVEERCILCGGNVSKEMAAVDEKRYRCMECGSRQTTFDNAIQVSKNEHSIKLRKSIQWYDFCRHINNFRDDHDVSFERTKYPGYEDMLYDDTNITR